MIKSRRPRLRRLLSAATACGVVSTALPVAPAAAYPIIPGTPDACLDPVVVWTGSNWTSTLQTRALTGFSRWEVSRRFDGSRITDVRTGPAVGAQTFVELATPPGGANGLATCANIPYPVADIKLSPSATGSQTGFQNLAMHEMGHVLGLGHTGESDGHEWYAGSRVNPSVMSTCFSSGFSRPSAIQMDDEAALTRQLGKENGLRVMTPNGGFERGNRF